MSFALRAEVTSRLSSSGGRPSLDGTTRRQKIPLSDTDWALLEQLAENLADQEYRPSPSQVASILLHRALKSLSQAEDSEPPPELKTGTHE